MKKIFECTWFFPCVFLIALFFAIDNISLIAHAQEADDYKNSENFLYNDFSRTVFLKGNIAIVSAERENSVYIFERIIDEWRQVEKLTVQGLPSSARFGYSTSYDNNTLMIGAHADNKAGKRSGSVYVFERKNNEWQKTSVLSASDASEGDLFGMAVSLSGDTVLIGAYADDDGGEKSGSVYVFERKAGEWVETEKLHASDAKKQDWFGFSVSLDKNIALIGAYGSDEHGNHSGSAYIFERDNDQWLETAKLMASDAAPDHLFSRSLVIKDGIVLVGAHGDDTYGLQSGAVYVYERDGEQWVQSNKITAPDGKKHMHFGNFLSFDGKALAIGAYGDRGQGGYAGSVYIFERGEVGWQLMQKVTASDSDKGDFFGHSVSIDNGTLLVGAYGDDVEDGHYGSAYVFHDNSEWQEEEKLKAWQ